MKINEILKNIFNQTAFDLNAVYAFLFGMLGALIILTTIHFFVPPFPTFAKVNVTAIVDQFIKEEAVKNLSDMARKEEVQLFGKKLETNLQHIAKTHHLVLLPSEAVIAGVPDYTPAIRKKLKRLSNEALS
ncbi:MAG: putative pilus extension/retraction protein trbI [Gammaproteobacteria bacterium]|jgi:type-F conjugative transfer system protein TrbI|nr:putative pilus extension/retraction protein trbI [Gammaproteobacteria bacterium]